MSLYSDPSFIKAYPFAAAIKQALLTASVRPKTPYYQNVSIVISHAVSPPVGINPAGDAGADHRRYQQRARRQGPDPVRSALAGRRAEER